ncbi:DUF937 domain-containing protein [Schlesneria sp. DSM 10557]|uniref:DUF937 domain-containing protein n=1 Tax=Schlesneria sp. DSM 10557 TaxID=3044399 RepID=UPI00359FABF0
MNIVEMILKALSGDTLKTLSAAIGETPENVQKAISAIVPTLLSGLGSLAAKPEGGEKIWNSLRKVDENVADDLGGVLSGGGADDLAKKGTGILEDLLGKGGLTALIGSIASFLASNPALVKKLLPLVAPFILSFLGKQVKSQGLDLGGLLKMILSQKSNIAKAMPAGLADSLSGVQGLGDFSNFVSDSARSVRAAGDKAAAAASDSMQWMVPLVALVVLLAAGAWWLNNSKPPAGPGGTPTPANPPTAGVGTLGSAPGPQDPAETVTKDFGGYMRDAYEALDSVTDVATAEAATEKLTAVTAKVDSLTSVIEDLPSSSRAIVTSIVKQSQSKLQEKIDKVLSIPGVEDVLKPVLNGLTEKITVLLNTPAAE